jgi:hypothetical protein
MIQSSAAAHQFDAPAAGIVSYRVPWSVDRSTSPRFRITNTSDESLRGVTLSLLGSAVMASDTPRVVPPGESFTVLIRGRDIARDTILIVRWFRDGDGEYLWRVSF